ncbi:Mitogen-activated protein kinase [Phytophthora fragariae]|uniref:Mitogen-activated protein kinase n=1 Tax=Phytophthora fragariae TaxID=53985 RepID=A0A6A3QWP2_9STRA|nr:Mitogen-activated protein kinase [Phytophthora fragariae]KAE8927338.1 Mitogen-activated protein kinase [Phytophthora fragariae]KAE8985765.1 Mitogen-activated protein kinase [Phytophthora fragariae]KAE9084349.1 Mitogen-activated protein kinase [Phytophthora fragariae]KAE9084736.1 Mitogen-activated protein kinase [Phytophthora fragariae]
MERPASSSSSELPAACRDLLLGALSSGSAAATSNLDDLLLLDSSAASTPAAMTHEVHWEGYVRKKGDWLPRWEERYLILDGASLTYYNSKEEARSARNLRGRMILSKVRPENYGKAHGFLLETQGHKHFHLCCATELEKDMWVEMMQAAIEEGVRHGGRVSAEGVEALQQQLQLQTSPTQVDLRGFYLAFRQLLISHSSSPQFFPKLSRDVVLTSNYAPTVPFWGEYHGLDGVLHFFSILYETVEITAFFVTDIAQAKEGCTAVVAGRETMKNRDNGRKFTQQWQHTIEFAPDGRVKSLTISADPIAASAVFGCSATSSLSLPMAAVVGNTVHDNPPGRLHCVVFRGEQISDQGFIDDEEQTDESEADDEMRPSNRRVFLGMRLVTDGKTNVYAPTSSSNCVARTRTCDPDEARNPKWNSKHEISFAGSSRGKPCFILIEAWEVVDSDDTGEASERVIGVAKVNLAPFLALASTSRTVRESVIHSDIARGAVPQWYTLLSANETKFTCGRVQLSISFEASMTSFAAMSRSNLASAVIDEVSPGLDPNAPTPQVRRSGSMVQSMSHRVALARGCSFRDTKRDNHQFRVGNTNFDVPKRYQMIKAVGQGAYGCVIAASDTETGQALAIKNIPNAFNDLIDAKRILREIRLMRHLNHPNLVNLLDLLRPPTLQEFNDVYIVTDLMETDLHRVIHSNQSISDDHVQYFLYQMLVAINYVHSAEVLHRDLKPSNILVNSDCDLKLCDFGLARGIQGMDSGLTEYVVTRWYRAPELLLSSKYDKQMDVWAIGCILAEMLGRRPLFPGHDYLHQLKIIMDVVGSPSEDSLDFITNPKAKRFILRQPKKPKVPLSSVYPRATPQCLDLLEKMLVFDPRKRITIPEALEHPYLSAVRDRSLEKTCPTPFDFAFENSDLTKQKLQELIFEDVCAFHPDARIPDPVVPAASAGLNSVSSRAHGISRSDSSLAPVSDHTYFPVTAPIAASAVAASVAVPPAPVTLVAPGSLQKVDADPLQSQVQARPSPIVLLPPNSVSIHEARPSETPVGEVASPTTPETFSPSVPVSAPTSVSVSMPPMPTVSVEPLEQVPASAPEHERSAQVEVAIEIMQTPAHTAEVAAEEAAAAAAEVSLDDIGSTPIHNVSVAESATTVDESGVTDQDAPNSTSTSSSDSDGEGDLANTEETEREIDLSTSPKKQVLQQPKSLLTPSSLV